MYDQYSGLADAIRQSSEFIELITETLRNHANGPDGVPQWFIDNPDPDNWYHTFDPWHLNDVDIGFESLTDDLHLAIGTGHFVRYLGSVPPPNPLAPIPGSPLMLKATVRRNDLELIGLVITGTLYDIFDFFLNAGIPSHQASQVQAGYNPTAGMNAGHIFETLVTLDYVGLDFVKQPDPHRRVNEFRFNFGPT